MTLLHLDVLFLALASSTDNLAVGVSIGASAKKRRIWTANLIISTCNALGALIAGIGGSYISSWLPEWAPMLLSSLAFGFLSVQAALEYREEVSAKKKRRKSEDNSQPKDYEQDSMETSEIFQLALPMTLNNLAGGMAGGSIGMPPILASSYAWIVSFATMGIGFIIGRRAKLLVEPSLLSSALFAVLFLVTSHETFTM